MLSKHELALEVEERTGVKPGLTKRILSSIAEIAKEELAAGEDFLVPGVAKVQYRYTKPFKKGEKYKKGEERVMFGGATEIAEADSPAQKAKIRLVATPMGPVKQHMPKSNDPSGQAAFLKGKTGKAIAKRKG